MSIATKVSDGIDSLFNLDQVVASLPDNPTFLHGVGAGFINGGVELISDGACLATSLTQQITLFIKDPGGTTQELASSVADTGESLLKVAKTVPRLALAVE